MSDLHPSEVDKNKAETKKITSEKIKLDAEIENMKKYLNLKTLTVIATIVAGCATVMVAKYNAESKIRVQEIIACQKDKNLPWCTNE